MKTEASNTIISEYSRDIDFTGEYIAIERLYLVYLKLRKELIEKEDGFQTHEQYYRFNATYTRRSAIEVALIQGDIAELHAEIVKGITFLNEQKK